MLTAEQRERIGNAFNRLEQLRENLEDGTEGSMAPGDVLHEAGMELAQVLGDIFGEVVHPWGETVAA